jgi:DNA polymerase-3 subunit gamma/tau
MMATTELHKIPDTILSRSQVFEFRTIPAALIAVQLRTIADAEGVTVSDSALGLMARAAEGSMRDAQSAFDQVIAFAGTTITSEDVATVLGLVGRDLLFGLLDAVVAEDAPAAFAFADRAVEAGSDLRIVCRELARVVRDLMIVSVDPSRASELEMGEGERERLEQLAARFSREDLMRAFDLLSKLDFELRHASYPRYQFEMALLKWMHLRKLVPLAELLEQAGPSAAAAPKMPVLSKPAQTLQAPRAPLPTARVQPLAPKATANPNPPNPESRIPNPGTSSAGLKDALLAEIRAKKGLFYNTVVAQAQKIEVASDRVTFAFLPTHRALREQLEVTRPWLEAAAARIAGRPVAVVAVQLDGPSAPPAAVEPDEPHVETDAPAEMPKDRRNLKAEAMSSTTVQAMLDVFPAEIRDVEEI